MHSVRARAIAVGIISSLFFSLTFIINRRMSFSGGNWIWSAAHNANASFYGQLTAIANNVKLFKSMELILKDANKTDGQDKATEFKKLKQELEVYQKD